MILFALAEPVRREGGKKRTGQPVYVSIEPAQPDPYETQAQYKPEAQASQNLPIYNRNVYAYNEG